MNPLDIACPVCHAPTQQPCGYLTLSEHAPQVDRSPHIVRIVQAHKVAARQEDEAQQAK